MISHCLPGWSQPSALCLSGPSAEQSDAVHMNTAPAVSACRWVLEEALILYPVQFKPGVQIPWDLYLFVQLVLLHEAGVFSDKYTAATKKQWFL